MNIIFSRETLPEEGMSIFLAGPTPRSKSVPSWRPEALEILEGLNFEGTVFIPEDRKDEGGCSLTEFNYPEQILWERKALLMSEVVIFWIPRNIENMPGFTTNVEYGFVSERRQNFVLGYPKDAPKMRYLDWIAREKNMPVVHSLKETIEAAIKMLN